MELIGNTLDEVRWKCMEDMLWTVATVYQDKLIYDMGAYDNKGLRLKQDCIYAVNAVFTAHVETEIMSPAHLKPSCHFNFFSVPGHCSISCTFN